MSDVKCPYCGTEQEINHDDGYGYEEDRTHEQDCVSCNKKFKFTTSIVYHYEVECQEADHDMYTFGDQWPNMYECSKCDFYEKREWRKPIEEDKTRKCLARSSFYKQPFYVEWNSLFN